MGGGGAGTSATNVPSASGSKHQGGGAEPGKEKGSGDTLGVPSLSSVIAGSTSGGVGVKERIQDWIQLQATRFLDCWSGTMDQNPALEVVSQLTEAAQQLELPAPSCTTALSVSMCMHLVCVCVCVCVCVRIMTTIKDNQYWQ